MGGAVLVYCIVMNVYLNDLAKMGARIYFFQEGFMHQKVMLINDRYTLVGTVNFDNRSFRLNFEITAVVSDRGIENTLQSLCRKPLMKSCMMNALSVCLSVLQHTQFFFKRLHHVGIEALADLH